MSISISPDYVLCNSAYAASGEDIERLDLVGMNQSGELVLATMDYENSGENMVYAIGVVATEATEINERICFVQGLIASNTEWNLIPGAFLLVGDAGDFIQLIANDDAPFVYQSDGTPIPMEEWNMDMLQMVGRAITTKKARFFISDTPFRAPSGGDDGEYKGGES